MDGMERLLTPSLRRSGALGWASLLPVVMLVCMVYWGIRPWTFGVVLAAGAIALLAPAVAADLLPVALIGLACVAFGLIGRDSVLPQGSGTTDGYPLHALVFGDGLPHVVDLSMGIVMLAFGVWLVPRTIGAHSALTKRNSELVSQVRRLTATRVDAVDTAAAELRRVERDLHDGAQARLVAMGISLRATERLIRTDPDAAVSLVAEARENSARALAELRALVRGINPPVLAERGLGDAIRALALDCRCPPWPISTCQDAFRRRWRRRHTLRSPRRSPTSPSTPMRVACTSGLSTHLVGFGSRSPTMAWAAPIRRVAPGCAG